MTRRYFGPAVLACALLLVGYVSAQDEPLPVVCSVEIRQTSSVTYSSTVNCTVPPGSPQFVVVAESATALNHTVIYRLNGEQQELGINFTEDGSLDGALWAFDSTTAPGLIGFGFVPDPVLEEAPANGQLVVTASVIGVNLPTVAQTRAFSALRFATVRNLTIRDSVFDRISVTASNTQRHAAVAYADDLRLGFDANPTITIINSTFSNFVGSSEGSAVSLGSLSSTAYGLVTIRDTDFIGNRGVFNGVALNVDAGSCFDPQVCRLLITGCNFTNNTNTLSQAGAARINRMNAVISDTQFISNTAATSGGALLFQSSDGAFSLTVEDSLFQGNVAGTRCLGPVCNVENECGGAMSVISSYWTPTSNPPQWFGSTVLTVRGTSFIGNSNGQINTAGAVCFGRMRTGNAFGPLDIYGAREATAGSIDSTATFVNSTFAHNYIPRDTTTGGALFDMASHGLTVDNCTFFNNTAGRGSAIFGLWTRYVNITGGTIIDSSVSRRTFGGAVAVSDLGSEFIIDGATFVNNRCTRTDTQPVAEGGAVWLERQLEEQPGLPANYTASIRNAQFINNTCQMAGALFIRQVAHTVGPNVVFDGNSGTIPGAEGGAVGIRTLGVRAQLPVAQPSSFVDTIFRNNYATAVGGGIFTIGIWAPSLRNCSFVNNSVGSEETLAQLGNSGGAACFTELLNAPLIINGSSFTNNTAYQGGAIVVGQNNVSMTSCSFEGNVATGEGGAVRWITASRGRYQVNITSTTFTRNRALNAGALTVSEAGLILSNCVFTDNAAQLAGGAVRLQDAAPLNSTTLGLYAPAYGLDPSASFNNQAAYIINCSFERNSAALIGGGAVHATTSHVVLVNSAFRENNSTVNGGSISGEQSVINDYQGTFQANRARVGGAIYMESCDVTLNATQILDNTASRGGALALTLARIDSPFPGIRVAELNGCTARGNTAEEGVVLGAGSGGCISAEGVNLTLRGGTYNSNTAAVGGGAIDARGLSTLVIDGVTDMDQNAAVSGNGGVVNIDGMAQVIINSTTMRNSTARENGGCLWAGNSLCVILLNSTLTGCSSTSDTGGAAWVNLPGSVGCSAAAVSSLPLSRAGEAVLPAALGTPTQAAGRRLLQLAANATSVALNFLAVGSTIRQGRAVNGGGLALQSTPGGSAVLDQTTVTACSAVPTGTCALTGARGTTASDGGGLYLAMVRPATSRVTGDESCRVSNDTSTVYVTSSVLSSNNATSGNGGAAAITSPDVSLVLHVTVINTTISNNVASNGGALAVDGPGAFLTVQTNSTLRANTAAPPTPESAAGAAGGCIYARGCQGVLLGNDTFLSQCQALPGVGGLVSVGSVIATSTGRSIGGGMFTDGCQAVVLDGTTVTSSIAGAGGGVAARDTGALALLNALITGNTASVGNVTATLASALDTLRGVGGGFWATGRTASLIRSSQVSGNSAGLFGAGAAAVTTCNIGGTRLPVQVPTLLADYPMLTSLANRAAGGCYALTVQSSLVTDNTAQNSGGAFFAEGPASIFMSGCSDMQTPQSGTVSRSSNLGEVFDNLRTVASCNSNNNRAVTGFGPIVATLPASMTINPNTTRQQLDPSNPNATLPDVPIVRFLQNGSFVLPSSSPLTPAEVHMRVRDAAGQDVRDPYMSNLITISANSSDTVTDTLDIYGQRQARYSNASMDYVFDGISIRAIVGRGYTFDFTLTTALAGGVQVQPLMLNIVVPDCGNGETYTDPNQRTACRPCTGSFFAFSSNNSLGYPAPTCFPCPTDASCSGGAVLVPASGLWHSAPNSTSLQECMNNIACERDDAKVDQLQRCQSAWYEFRKVHELNALTDAEVDEVAQFLLNKYSCTLYTVGTLTPLDPRTYLNMLCADGYGGNLCGVCVPNSEGKQTAMRSNNACSECSKDYVVYLVTALLFTINLLIILIQAFAALGEQMTTNTIQFADILGAIINHVQYLIVILKLQFDWPEAVTEFHKVAAATVSFADDAIKFASITCLSDGSPESQATYQMGASLTMPLLLVCAALFIWIITYYIRLYWWYPRLDRLAKEAAKAAGIEEDAGDGADAGNTDVNQVIMEEPDENAEHPETPGGPHTPQGNNGEATFGRISGPSYRSAPGPSSRFPSGRMPAASGRLTERPSEPAGPGLPAAEPPKKWSDAIRNVVSNQPPTDIPTADEGDDAPPPGQNNMLSVPAPSLRRNQTDLRRWQLPGADKPPEETLWFDSDKKARELRKMEDKHALTLVEKMRLLDKYMPLPQQLLAVTINASFVVYQGWLSAALNPFACEVLDDGELDDNFPESLQYYKDFQLATAEYGYWQTNMNQACYEGEHLHKWVPIGAIISFVLGFGIPLLMFLPVFINRKLLTGADTQLRWGWLYIRFYYGRLPYWMPVQALELLLFIIVQTFTSGLNSVTEQAALLQLTLVVLLVFNTCMWPLVHPLLILINFLSNAILIFTLGLAIIIGDGIAWELTEAGANTAGAFVIIVNVAYVLLLIILFYKHMRDVIQEGFLDASSKTRNVVTQMWKRSLMATRNLRSIRKSVNLRNMKSVLRRTGKKERATDTPLDKGLPTDQGAADDGTAKGEVAPPPVQVTTS